MAKYHSGQKVIQQRVDALQREMDALKSITPVYTVEQRSTYGKCLASLRDAYANGNAGLQPKFVQADGSSIVRPLTFEETIDAIVNAYESGNRELLTGWNDSCTGIAYKVNTTKFKIRPSSQDLILLGEDFRSPFVSADYAAQDGTELDKNKGKYDVQLTKPEVLKNPGWLTAVSDRALLKAFRDIVFAERETDIAMGFYLRNSPQQDELRALAVGSLSDDSGADDRDDFGYDARFVRITQALKAIKMEISSLYADICSYNNLELAFKMARKGKTQKEYVIECH